MILILPISGSGKVASLLDVWRSKVIVTHYYPIFLFACAHDLRYQRLYKLTPPDSHLSLVDNTL